MPRRTTVKKNRRMTSTIGWKQCVRVCLEKDCSYWWVIWTLRLEVKTEDMRRWWVNMDLRWWTTIVNDSQTLVRQMTWLLMEVFSHTGESTKPRGCLRTIWRKTKLITSVCQGGLDDLLTMSESSEEQMLHQITTSWLAVWLKLKREFTGETGHRVRYNTALLREDAKREKFKLTLSNKFQALEELREDQDFCIQE